LHSEFYFDELPEDIDDEEKYLVSALHATYMQHAAAKVLTLLS